MKKSVIILILAITPTLAAADSIVSPMTGVGTMGAYNYVTTGPTATFIGFSEVSPMVVHIQAKLPADDPVWSGASTIGDLLVSDAISVEQEPGCARIPQNSSMEDIAGQFAVLRFEASGAFQASPGKSVNPGLTAWQWGEDSQIEAAVAEGCHDWDSVEAGNATKASPDGSITMPSGEFFLSYRWNPAVLNGFEIEGAIENGTYFLDELIVDLMWHDPAHIN